MNYIKISKCDIANGEGVRVVLWCSGCDLRCKNCHNQEALDFNSGLPFTDQTMNELIDAMNKPHIQGLTLSGGHPLAPANRADVLNIITTIKRVLPDKDIWLYTGYDLNYGDFSTLYKGIDQKSTLHNQKTTILRMCDVVVDGRYIDDIRDISLKFRGSINQRLIDVPETLQQQKIVLLNA